MEKIIKCKICNKEINADSFAEHVTEFHSHELIETLTDDEIINRIGDCV